MSDKSSGTVEYPYLEIVEVDCEMGDLLSNKDAAESLVDSIARSFNLELFKTTTHEFDPHGITSVGIVGESHISIHTWPENDYCHIEIFSCRELPPTGDIRAELEGSVESVLKVRKLSR